MASITINIPDAVAPRVIDAICAYFGYTTADGSKPAFAKRQMINWMKDITKGQERHAIVQQRTDDMLAAQLANDADIDNNVGIN